MEDLRFVMDNFPLEPKVNLAALRERWKRHPFVQRSETKDIAYSAT